MKDYLIIKTMTATVLLIMLSLISLILFFVCSVVSKHCAKNMNEIFSLNFALEKTSEKYLCNIKCAKCS